MKNTKKFLILSAAAALVFGIASIKPQNSLSAPAQNRAGIVDADGDGICDITGRTIGGGTQAALQAGKGNRKGPGDGSGYQGNGPKDGTGYGAQSGKRNGPQNGTQARTGQGNRAGNGSQSMGKQGRRGGR